jgi:hypothetical protein
MTRFFPVPNSVINYAGVFLMAAGVSADDTSCSSTRRSMDDSYLDACRPQRVSAAEKRAVISSLPPKGEITDFSVAEGEKLRSLARVLEVHGRDDVYDIKVVDLGPATTALHGKAVLLISRSALRILGSDELQALTAHEIGHEYVWNEWHVASRHRNHQRLRDLELICDAVAALTLTRIGVPPERLLAALRRVDAYNAMGFGDALDRSSHPTLSQRDAVVARVKANNKRAPANTKRAP